MHTATTTSDDKRHSAAGGLGALMLGALGVVYGDIGTSPLYTLKTALEWAGGATPTVAIGMLSLIVWTLLITTSLKYVAVVMRADNDGEGGILALMSLLGIKHGERMLVIAIGVLGAALLYGDGAITPAISVLSALEGLKIPVPEIAPDIVGLSALVLVGLFGLQSQGSGRIGKLFGPIMTVVVRDHRPAWVVGMLRHPGVLVAIDPRYGFNYLLHTASPDFWFLARYSCARPVPKRCTLTWGILGRGRSALPGTDLCCLAFCSTMLARPRLWSAARLPQTLIHSSCCVRPPSRSRSLRWRRLRRSSPASRSSAAHSR